MLVTCVFWVFMGIFALNANAIPTRTSFPLPPTKPDPSILASRKKEVGNWDLCNSNISDGVHLGSGIVGEKYRWRNGINFQPDPAFTQDEYNSINDALYELSTHVCIPFGIWPKGSTPTGDYVYITRSTNSGCNSAVGRQEGKQNMNLDYDGCIYHGTIMHETIHALGFWHEQSRPDRDNYVTINYQNIIPGKEHNFEKEEGTLMFTTYDYTSIMHYGPTAFTKNDKDTITAKNGATVGSTGELTKKDISKLRKMYNCD